MVRCGLGFTARTHALALRSILLETVKILGDFPFPVLVESLWLKTTLKFEISFAKRFAIGPLMTFFAVMRLDVTTSGTDTIALKGTME